VAHLVLKFCTNWLNPPHRVSLVRSFQPVSVALLSLTNVSKCTVILFLQVPALYEAIFQIGVVGLCSISISFFSMSCALKNDQTSVLQNVCHLIGIVLFILFV
jgi:hypothetical protein